MTQLRQAHHLLLQQKSLTMLLQLTSHISQYGYLAIFLLVLLQEVGVPTLIPNELVLLFSGYLSATGVLNLPLVVLSVVGGDLLGSSTLFLLFYFFGKIILQRKPKWIPLPEKRIRNIRNKINASGQSGIFVGRLTPFIKGYVTVLCGLMRVSPRRYAITLLSTSFIWALGYTCCGYFIGPYWKFIPESNALTQHLLLLITASIIIGLIALQLLKRLLSAIKINSKIQTIK
jgi:membrane protein DedA with SNARE-associated domain